MQDNCTQGTKCLLPTHFEIHAKYIPIFLQIHTIIGTLENVPFFRHAINYFPPSYLLLTSHKGKAISLLAWQDEGRSHTFKVQVSVVGGEGGE